VGGGPMRRGGACGEVAVLSQARGRRRCDPGLVGPDGPHKADG
jgi:hypothetical protein